MAYDYASKGITVTINGVRPLNGHVVEVGSQDDGSPHEIITYWQCTGGHVVIHTGHIDPKTMMSVEDGSIETTIPCPAADSRSFGLGWSIDTQDSSFLASVPPDFEDRVNLGDGMFVVATPIGSAVDSEPVSTIWATATCDGGHVIMHYGHEDPNTGTSVYDGAVTTSVPC